jgi:hypothetical protein
LNIEYDNGVCRKVEHQENEEDFNKRFDQWTQTHEEWFPECTQKLTCEAAEATWDRRDATSENSTPSRKSSDRPK